MEDMASKLSELLNNPDIMKKIKNLSLDDIIKEDNKNNEKKEPSNNFEGLSPEMIKTITKLMPILSSMNSNDDKYTSFLNSLRPLLSEPRQKKLDESAKFIKLIHILPLLKDNGILWGEKCINKINIHQMIFVKCKEMP